MSMTVQAPSHGPLRDYLMQQNSKLAEAANRTWEIAGEIHARQTEKGANVDGRDHVEQVEQNIWRFLNETTDRSLHKNLGKFEPIDLYLLSCAACCHDFDKGLIPEVLPDGFAHGEKSGDFVYRNWSRLGILSQHYAEYIDLIISIHHAKEDFDAKLQGIADRYVLPEGRGDLHSLATLLKAADTLHLDASRVCKLAVPDDTLHGKVRDKQLARGCTHGWRPDGERIIIKCSVTSEESATALQEFERYFREHEWPPIARNLKEHQFPHEIEFDWTIPRPLRTRLTGQALGSRNFEDLISQPIKWSQAEVSPSVTMSVFVSDEPLRLIAVPADEPAEYLNKAGPLSVIGNVYVGPNETELGDAAGAVNRIFVGPANCGKTRAALEWILDEIGLDAHAWGVLRPESGSIPQDASKFTVDFEQYYDRQSRPRPHRAILFADDLPEYLPPPGSGTPASEAVQRLLEWFRGYRGFQERRFVGTIRSEQMHDKPGWPDHLIQVGDLRLIRIEPLDEQQRRSLWQGMTRARTYRNRGFQELKIEIDEAFLDEVVSVEADPEAIVYYVRAIAEKGKRRIEKGDAASFGTDVAKIWIKETWPTVRDSYGPAACVFFTLARFIEAGHRPESGFPDGLTPAWEYHAVFGPPLLKDHGGRADDYLPALERMLEDGHATGAPGESARPRFDFLLQAPSLGEVEFPAPPARWFAQHAGNLSLSGQMRTAFLISLGGQPLTEEGVTAHWMLGHVMAMDRMAEHSPERAAEWQEQALECCNDLLSRFGHDETPDVGAAVATAMLWKGYILDDMGRGREGLEAWAELVTRFGDDHNPVIRETVARALLHLAIALGNLNQEAQSLDACAEILKRFGDEEELEIRKRVSRAPLTKAIALWRLGRPAEAVEACAKLVARFGDDREPDIREDIAHALFTKGNAFRKQGQDVEALETWGEVVTRFGDDQEAGSKKNVAYALFAKVEVFRERGWPAEAVATSEEFLTRFGDDAEPAVRAISPAVLLEKAIALIELSRVTDAVEAFRELVNRFGDDEEGVVRGIIPLALSLKAFFLGQLGRGSEMVEAYTHLLSRCGEDVDPLVREIVANALLDKGIALGELGRRAEAVEAWSELVSRFGDDEPPAIRELVHRAFSMQAMSFIKLWWVSPDRQLLEKAIIAGRQAAARGGRWCYNLACALSLAGEVDEALEWLERSLENEEIHWSHIAEDRDWDTLRDDPRYERLKEKYEVQSEEDLGTKESGE